MYVEGLTKREYNAYVNKRFWRAEGGIFRTWQQTSSHFKKDSFYRSSFLMTDCKHVRSPW